MSGKRTSPPATNRTLKTDGTFRCESFFVRRSRLDDSTRIRGVPSRSRTPTGSGLPVRGGCCEPFWRGLISWSGNVASGVMHGVNRWSGHSAQVQSVGVCHRSVGGARDCDSTNRRSSSGMGAALLRRGVFALFMGLFARGCVSPVLISGGQQPSQRVPASFRRPAEPRNGAEHRRSVPLRRAPFWTFTRRSGTVPWEGRQACDGCDDRIPATYIRRAANRRPLHRSPEPSPVRSGRCCLRGCQSPPLVQRSPADERERTRTGTAPAGPGFGTQAPARTSRPTQPERGCWSGRGHQRCRVLRAARARKPRRNGLRHDAGCGSGLRAARSRRLASARCRAEPAAGALLGRDAPPRDHRDRLAGTTAYALEATVVLDIIHVAAATRRAVLVAGSSKGLSAFGPRPDGSRPARGDTWLQLRRSSAAAGSRSLDAY